MYSCRMFFFMFEQNIFLPARAELCNIETTFFRASESSIVVPRQWRCTAWRITHDSERARASLDSEESFFPHAKMRRWKAPRDFSFPFSPLTIIENMRSLCWMRGYCMLSSCSVPLSSIIWKQISSNSVDGLVSLPLCPAPPGSNRCWRWRNENEVVKDIWVPEGAS